MIKGIGIDMTKVSRFERLVETERFRTRVFTGAELALIGTGPLASERMAGNYAVKEALAKALGCGLKGCPLDHVEVLRNGAGAPMVQAYGTVQEKLDALGVGNIWVTITHDGGMAAAVVVLEGD